MFVTEIPGSLEAAAGVLAGLGGMVASANGVAAGVHAAVVPMAFEPTALLLHAHHAIDAANYHATQAVGTANHMGIVAAMATSGVSYDASEAANMLTML